jgi:hypothetical protein
MARTDVQRLRDEVKKPRGRVRFFLSHLPEGRGQVRQGGGHITEALLWMGKRFCQVVDGRGQLAVAIIYMRQGGGRVRKGFVQITDARGQVRQAFFDMGKTVF